MELTERELAVPGEGVLVSPASGSDTGLLVLAGSSGRVERERARILAAKGALALALRWFGGPGQPPGICEIALETFTAAADLLEREGARRIAIMGVSKGAEAALLTAVRDARVAAVIALSPTSRVWCNVGPGRDGAQHPYRSSWTWRGRPLPFVPMDDSWAPDRTGDGPVAIRGWYEQSERVFGQLLGPAGIPAERTRAEVLLVAGGDDEMWPSLRFARELASRRRAAGLTVRLIARDDAGHRPRLPGEGPAEPSPRFRYGGTAEADALLGRAAWPHILLALGLSSEQRPAGRPRHQ